MKNFGRDPFEEVEEVVKDSIWKAPAAGGQQVQLQDTSYDYSQQTQQQQEKQSLEQKKKKGTREERKSSYLLSFTLGNEVLGAGVENIREVVRVGKITPVPNTPYHILGVMNLRGRIIPILSLRRLFGMADAPETIVSKILIAEDEGKFMGIIVDDVTEVMTFYTSDVEPILSLRFTDVRFAKGILRVADTPLVIVEIKEIMKASAQV